MVNAAREHELAAARLMEVVFGHRHPDRLAREFARAAVGDLVNRLQKAETERDAALAALRAVSEPYADPNRRPEDDVATETGMGRAGSHGAVGHRAGGRSSRTTLAG